MLFYGVSTIQYNTIQYKTQYSTVQYITIRYNTIQPPLCVSVSLIMSLRSTMFTKLTIVSPNEGVTVLGLQLWAVKETT